jgi:hypothetical protein
VNVPPKLTDLRAALRPPKWAVWGSEDLQNRA